MRLIGNCDFYFLTLFYGFLNYFSLIISQSYSAFNLARGVFFWAVKAAARNHRSNHRTIHIYIITREGA